MLRAIYIDEANLVLKLMNNLIFKYNLFYCIYLIRVSDENYKTIINVLIVKCLCFLCLFSRKISIHKIMK